MADVLYGAELDALRARIAELEAPVLPGEVAELVAHIRKHWAMCYGPDVCGRCPACRAAALLTRLSTVTAEDIGDASVLRFIAKQVPMRDSDREQLTRIAERLLGRAALTARLKEADRGPDQTA